MKCLCGVDLMISAPFFEHRREILRATRPYIRRHLPQVLRQHRHLHRLQEVHLSQDLALHRIRARNLVDEKEMHCSIGFLSSAGFVYSPSLGRCQLDSWHDGAWASSVPKHRGESLETRFTFAERVAYQRAIENVYWRHRIWPKERPDPKTIGRCRDLSGAAGKESCGLPA